MPNRFYSIYFIFLIIFIAVVAVDYLTKLWMLNLLFSPPRQIHLTSFFSLTPVWNEGISFGMLSGNPKLLRFLIPGLACLVVSYLIIQLPHQPFLLKIASAFIAGGAVGNVIDRLIYGKVVDFFDFHIAHYYWPAFNIADIAISCGVGLWLYVMIRSSSFNGEKR